MNLPLATGVLTAVGTGVGTWQLAGLLAQTGIPIDSGLGSLIGNLGVMGILVWHMWYHTTKTYPTMLDKFSTEIGQIRTAFQQEQTALRTAFLQEQASARDHNARETAELRAMVIQISGAMRTAVHDVRDTAQSALNKAGAATSGAPPVRWETRREPAQGENK